MPLDANLPRPLWVAFALLFGCLIGSFLNVVIYRVPREQSIVFPGSRCPHCGHAITWWENLPVVSWLLLGAKCSSCKAPISWRYPANEAATGLLWAALMALHGATWQFLGEAALVAALVVVFWIDLDTMLILDVVTFPFIALGLVYGTLVAQAPVASAAGALLGYGVYRFIEWASEKFLGRPGLGRGDAKLAAVIGAWMGPSGLLVSSMVAFTLGAVLGLILLWRSGRTLIQLSLPWARPLVYRDRQSVPFPFGPAMVAGAVLSLFWGHSVWTWYLGLLGFEA